MKRFMFVNYYYYYLSDNRLTIGELEKTMNRRWTSMIVRLIENPCLIRNMFNDFVELW